MTRQEMLRILSFMDETRAIAEKRTALSATDARWNIIAYAMRRHLEGKLLTITSAAMAADVPYGTAMRRVNELLETGLLHKRPRSSTGKSFSLHPTRKLIEEFESFAMQLKVMVGNTFGFATGDAAMEDFYFGGYYMASRILPYPNAVREGVGYDRSIRLALPIDPTFETIRERAQDLGGFLGTNLEVVNLSLDDLHAEIMANAGRERSDYDVVAVDLPWIGQLAEEGVIQPLDKIIAQHRFNPSDFHPTAYKGSSWAGSQYALPIQPTAEVLFCRSDLFSEAGLSVPETTEEVLFAAKMLHRSRMNLSGIVMNFKRGTPVAHTFLQTLASFGQPVIDLPRVGEDFDTGALSGENYRPLLTSDAARATAEFLLELRGYAHPDSLKCDWNRRIRIFTEGHAAMCYGWSVRAAAFELDDSSPAHQNVAFAPHPHGPGARTVSPIGGFSLALPCGLPAGRERAAWRVMEYLTRPEVLKWYVQHGNLSSPRFSTSADPEVQAKSGLLACVDAMERRGDLQTWPRPPIPEFSDIVAVLGEEIYRMLQGEAGAEETLARAQTRVDAIMRENGRY
ncbi:MAG: ABC transporter substrate-binding protein [Rhodobacteraceae bacterium CG17_big_fil_post_rev_8_21_14_2_50_65_11]|nr:MAG: ABC transporter substrate-binding protein [Rhodobacteraceae bacterium CG17_big_fil_post_rev_8_21_14_2_50_65_11]